MGKDVTTTATAAIKLTLIEPIAVSLSLEVALFFHLKLVVSRLTSVE
jgi:hypothetical protein